MQKKPIRQGKTIGIVGVGFMGGYFAEKFITKGYKVFLYDINNERLKEFSRKGAYVCATPEEVAQKADIVFEITPNDISSKEVWFGEHGILRSASADKVLIVCSTLSADWVDELAEKCEELGLHFFDVAINGGDNGLVFLCGGNKTQLKEITPVLRAVAARVVHFGPVGHGMRYKLILNFLQAVHIIGFAQAMKIAKEQKLNLKKVANTLAIRPGGALMGMLLDRYETPAESAIFKVELITKDLKYAKKLAAHLDVNLLDAVLAEYSKAVEKGYAKKDWTSILTLEE